jgi:hypothetical protein
VSSALGSVVPQVGCLGMMYITYKMTGRLRGCYYGYNSIWVIELGECFRCNLISCLSKQ